MPWRQVDSSASGLSCDGLRSAMTPRVSFIVNTACGDPIVGPQHNPYRSLAYSERARILAEEILPRADRENFDEIIVAGIFPHSLEVFPRVRFVNVAPMYRDRWDALPQREAGARYASGDILVFAHDDHAPGNGLVKALQELPKDVDVLVPKRIHQKTGAILINGGAEGYVGGHYVAMRREVWAKTPWTDAPHEDRFLWDVFLSKRWQEEGARICWATTAFFLDCEATESET